MYRHVIVSDVKEVASSLPRVSVLGGKYSISKRFRCLNLQGINSENNLTPGIGSYRLVLLLRVKRVRFHFLNKS